MKFNLKISAKSFSKLKTKLIYLMVTILLFSASILTKDFTTLLLNTFFNVKSEPIVNSLDDVIDHNNIKLASSSYYITLLNNSYNIDSDKMSKLLARSQGFIPSYNNMSSEEKVINIIEGKIILFLHSLGKKTFFQMFKQVKYLLYSPDQKYLPDFANLLIEKTHFLCKEVNYL